LSGKLSESIAASQGVPAFAVRLCARNLAAGLAGLHLEEECMICPRCRANVANGKKFCGDCGSPMPWVCSACGGENPSDKRFCGDCGATLAGGASSPSGAGGAREAPAPVATAAERRQLTVLFADRSALRCSARGSIRKISGEVINAYQAASPACRCLRGFVARW
jgi:hypothetical protein